MKQRLKDLAQAGGIPLEKLQSLIDVCGGDERWVESILLGASATEKAALFGGVAYKADDAGGLDPLDQAYIALRDALDAGDQAGVQQALGQLAELAQSPPPPPAAPVDVKARVLTDSGDQSVFSSASKGYNDIFAAVLGSDQLTRPAIKSAPADNPWMAVLGGQPVGGALDQDLFGASMRGERDADPQFRAALIAQDKRR